MSTTAEWLALLGMSEYAGRFAENRIDLSVLRDLTDQDLKDLGVEHFTTEKNQRPGAAGSSWILATRRRDPHLRLLPAAAGAP